MAREHYNTIRLHAGIGYVTPDDEHTGRGESIRNPAKLAWKPPGSTDLHGTEPSEKINTTKDPSMWSDSQQIFVANSETRQLL